MPQKIHPVTGHPPKSSDEPQFGQGLLDALLALDGGAVRRGLAAGVAGVWVAVAVLLLAQLPHLLAGLFQTLLSGRFAAERAAARAGLHAHAIVGHGLQRD